MIVIVKNFEKVLVLISLFLCVAAYFILSTQGEVQEELKFPLMPRNVELPAKEEVIKTDPLLVTLGHPEPFENYQGIMQRSIFSELRTSLVDKSMYQDRSFILLNVEHKLFPLEYKGRIKTNLAFNIAQINWNNRTYFVEAGDVISKYKIDRITQNTVVLKNTQGSDTIILKYLQPSQAKELIATVMDMNNNKMQEIEKGMELDGYNVLDITLDSVLLLQGEKKIIIKRE
ncbi:MAG: hypothetical protein ABH952_09115 [Candidatus Omnitrophota bacterium]